MKLDSIFNFFKDRQKKSQQEEKWEGERFVGLFRHMVDVEEEKRKVIPQLTADFRDLLRTVEKNFEQIVKEKWDGSFSFSPFYFENIYLGDKVNSGLRLYTISYGIHKSDGINRLRVSIISEQRYDALICDIFNCMEVGFLVPEYNEKGVYFIRKDRIELVVNFYQPNIGVVNLDDL